MKDWIRNHVDGNLSILNQLLSNERVSFDQTIRSRLPEDHGIYAISVKDCLPGRYLRAGRTKTAQGGLRQRIYQNHLMGNQSGNLASQLIADGSCDDHNQAKSWIRKHCVVQFLRIDDDTTRRWAEHFMLSVLRPTHSD